MEGTRGKPYRIAKKLSQLFVLESKLDTVLSASIYYLNEFMGSERLSIFIFQPWNQVLAVFSSLDLEKNEISIPKSFGIAGWVFRHRKSAIVQDAYNDTRFYREIDERTGFRTRNLICAPLLLDGNQCLGTLQSVNKKKGGFTVEDLEVMNLAAHMVAIAINNGNRYAEVLNTNTVRKKIIEQFVNADISLSIEPSHRGTLKSVYHW